MEFQQYPVSKILQSQVSHYWTLKCDAVDEANMTYRFIPDGSVDWVFHLGKPWSYSFSVDNYKKHKHSSHLIGQFKRYMDLTLPADSFYLFGVSFHSWAARKFWKVDMHEVTDEAVDLSDLDIPDMKFLEEALHEAADPDSCINLVESFLIRRLPVESDPLLEVVIDKLSQNSKQLQLSDFGISQRRLEQRFKTEIGISPKLFQRTIRVNKIIHQLIHRPKVPLTQLAYDFGFYDQSHFIADFKRFTGSSPSRFLKSINPSGAIFNYRVG